MANDSAKVPFTKGECEAIADTLHRVVDAVTPIQVPMFLGGPLPSDVLGKLIDMVTDRASKAVIAGPMMPAPKDTQ